MDSPPGKARWKRKGEAVPDLSGWASPALVNSSKGVHLSTNEKGHEPGDLVADSWPLKRWERCGRYIRLPGIDWAECEQDRERSPRIRSQIRIPIVLCILNE
jgi:hypothetical protein